MYFIEYEVILKVKPNYMIKSVENHVFKLLFRQFRNLFQSLYNFDLTLSSNLVCKKQTFGQWFFKFTILDTRYIPVFHHTAGSPCFRYTIAGALSIQVKPFPKMPNNMN